MSESPLSSVPNDTGGLVYRELEGQGELQACVALQEQVWGGGFLERVPSAMLMVATRVGGVVAGAFDRDG